MGNEPERLGRERSGPPGGGHLVRNTLLVLVVLLPIALAALWAWNFCQQMEFFAELSRSHVEGNVPPAGVFDEFLTRDLTEALAPRDGKEYSVRWMLLRDRPTQVGMSWPKFYLWAKVVRADGEVVREGAAKVAAIERIKFHLCEFVSRAEIAEHPGAEGRFPDSLGPIIRERAGLK